MAWLSSERSRCSGAPSKPRDEHGSFSSRGQRRAQGTQAGETRGWGQVWAPALPPGVLPKLYLGKTRETDLRAQPSPSSRARRTNRRSQGR